MAIISKSKCLIGLKFGRLKVVSFSHTTNGVYYWNVLCDCGSKRTKRAGALTQTKSCGCLRDEKNKEIHKYTIKHGHTKNGVFSLTYQSWVNLCHRINPSNEKEKKKHFRYAGISFDKSWLCFENFLADMGERPSKDFTLDRVDNDIGYFKNNCRWADKMTQARNRKSTIWVEENGRKQCIIDWARDMNIPATRLYRRIKLGWTPRQALGFDVK